MEDTKVWGLWNKDSKEWFFADTCPWSFDRESFDPETIGKFHADWLEVREMSDHEIAMIPEAAAAVVALLDMRAARIRVNAAKAEYTHWMKK